MKGVHSYPKVWTVGHPNTDRLFNGPVVVQEKIDGSQFSFGIRVESTKNRSATWWPAG